MMASDKYDDTEKMNKDERVEDLYAIYNDYRLAGRIAGVVLLALLFGLMQASVLQLPLFCVFWFYVLGLLDDLWILKADRVIPRREKRWTWSIMRHLPFPSPSVRGWLYYLTEEYVPPARMWLDDHRPEVLKGIIFIVVVWWFFGGPLVWATAISRLIVYCYYQ